MLKPSHSHSSTSSSIGKARGENEETPQSFWLNKFLRRASGVALFSGNEHEFKASLVKDLAEAVELFSVDKFRTDYYFLLIWLSYIQLQL